jgi:hypothetical protein
MSGPWSILETPLFSTNGVREYRQSIIEASDFNLKEKQGEH